MDPARPLPPPVDSAAEAHSPPSSCSMGGGAPAANQPGTIGVCASSVVDPHLTHFLPCRSSGGHPWLWTPRSDDRSSMEAADLVRRRRIRSLFIDERNNGGGSLPPNQWWSRSDGCSGFPLPLSPSVVRWARAVVDPCDDCGLTAAVRSTFNVAQIQARVRFFSSFFVFPDNLARRASLGARHD